ncbi:MAG: DUF2298 domain-containing protein [Dehalococcoidia bacterium]
MDMMILVAVHEVDLAAAAGLVVRGSPALPITTSATPPSTPCRASRTSPCRASPFNLGLATAGAMAAAAAFGLAADAHALTTRRAPRTWMAGSVAVGALVLIASLEGGLDARRRPTSAALFLGEAFGVTGFPSRRQRRRYPHRLLVWWRATRVLPDAISEFPAFSLILGDLHAHVLALPLAILALGVALTALEGSRPQTLAVWVRHPGELAVVSMLFAGIAMTNAWDAPLYGAIWAGAGVLAYAAAGWGLVGGVMGMVRHLVLPAGLAGVLAWPMFSVFDHVPLGVAPVLSAGSDPARFLLVWGPLVLFLAACVATIRPRVDREIAALTAVYASALVLAWVLALFASGHGSAVIARGSGWLTLLALAGVAALSLGGTSAAMSASDRGRAAWLALVAGASLLILGTELVHLVDALAGRFNTVFKFWYGAWVMLALACGIAAADTAGDARTAARVASAPAARVARESLWWAATAVVVLCALYTPAALVSRRTEGQAPGLDALAFLSDDGSGEAETVRWAATLDAGSVLLEAPGKSYSDANRVSMAAGVPTVLGWAGHEVTWRGDGAGVSEREADVNAIYRDGPTPATIEVARRYGVTHVFVGPVERERYGEDVGARFAAWPVAFQASRSLVFAVPQEVRP